MTPGSVNLGHFFVLICAARRVLYYWKHTLRELDFLPFQRGHPIKNLKISPDRRVVDFSVVQFIEMLRYPVLLKNLLPFGSEETVNRRFIKMAFIRRIRILAVATEKKDGLEAHPKGYLQYMVDDSVPPVYAFVYCPIVFLALNQKLISPQKYIDEVLLIWLVILEYGDLHPLQVFSVVVPDNIVSDTKIIRLKPMVVEWVASEWKKGIQAIEVGFVYWRTCCKNTTCLILMDVLVFKNIFLTWWNEHDIYELK